MQQKIIFVFRYCFICKMEKQNMCDWIVFRKWICKKLLQFMNEACCKKVNAAEKLIRSFWFLLQKFYLQNSMILLVFRTLQLFLKTVLIKKEFLLPIANFHSTKSIWTSKKLQLNNKSWQNIFETNRQVNDFLLLLMLLNVYSRHDLFGWFFLTFSEAFTGFIIYFDSPMSWI